MFYFTQLMLFLALFEISLNYFNMSHPRRKRGKAKDACLRRRLQKGETRKGFFFLVQCQDSAFEVNQEALLLLQFHYFVN